MASPIDRRFGPVVVAADDSPEALAALAWAAEAAARRKCQLWPVWVFRPVHTVGTPLEAIPSVERQRRAAHRQLTEFAESVVSTVPVCPLLVEGDRTAQLASISMGASLLVLGCERLHAIDVVLGSPLIRLAAYPPCPVAIVPLRSAGLAGSRSADAPVVVGVTGGASDAEPVAFALDECERSGRPLVALHATETAPDGGADAHSDVGAGGEMAQVGDIEAWRRAHPAVRVDRRCVDGAAGAALVCASHEAFMLVLGRPPKINLRQAAAVRLPRLGGILHTVIRGADCPVLMVPC
jgi:nucleotide-binding universal stress UspA family protein